MLIFNVDTYLEAGYDDSDVQEVANEAQMYSDKTGTEVYVKRGEKLLVVAVPEVTNPQVLRRQIDAVLED